MPIRELSDQRGSLRAWIIRAKQASATQAPASIIAGDDLFHEADLRSSRTGQPNPARSKMPSAPTLRGITKPRADSNRSMSNRERRSHICAMHTASRMHVKREN